MRRIQQLILNLTKLLPSLVFLNIAAAQDSVLVLVNPLTNSTEKWLLQLEDQFDGNYLDSDKWKVIEGVPRDPQLKNQIHYFLPENIEISNGTCKLWARKTAPQKRVFSIWEVDKMVDYANTFEYTSAEIHSKKLYGFGRYEIRCKIPKGKGFWPAFWLYGEPKQRNNELDVFEYWNAKGAFGQYRPELNTREIHMTTHFNGRMSGESVKGPDASEDFHVYTLVWDPCSIQWYLDGELYRVLWKYKGMNKRKNDCASWESKKRKIKENVFPQDEGLAIILDLAIQSGEKAPDAETIFPQAMEVDYVRVWKRLE